MSLHVEDIISAGYCVLFVILSQKVSAHKQKSRLTNLWLWITVWFILGA